MEKINTSIIELSHGLLLLPVANQTSFEILKDAVLVIEDGVFVYIGTFDSEFLIWKTRRMSEMESSGHTYTYLVQDCSDRILLAPFANTHCHLAMSIFRNSPANYSLHDWLEKWIFPKERQLTPEIVKIASQLSLLELSKSGVASVADMYFFPESILEAVDSSGMRALLSLDKKTNLDGVFQEDFKALESVLASIEDNKLVQPSLHVHSLYLYQKELYEELADFANTVNIPIQIHLAETVEEVQIINKNFSASPVEALKSFRLLIPGSILAHCNYLSDSDILLLKDQDVYLAHNPASNAKLASGICDTERLIKNGLQVSLGTDGAGSNDRLDFFDDLRFASFYAKLLHKDVHAGDAESWLYRASITGAKAIRQENTLGLELGQRADVLILNPNALRSAPFTDESDPISFIVYTANASCVESLMIDGKWIVKDSEHQLLDEEKILFEANRASKLLQIS